MCTANRLLTDFPRPNVFTYVAKCGLYILSSRSSSVNTGPVALSKPCGCETYAFINVFWVLCLLSIADITEQSAICSYAMSSNQ